MDDFQFKIRQFRIISDISNNFKPVDAICQFVYRNRLINISTSGQSIGASQHEIVVFENPSIESNINAVIYKCMTVEEAIDFINSLT